MYYTHFCTWGEGKNLTKMNYKNIHTCIYMYFYNNRLFQLRKIKEKQEKMYCILVCTIYGT